MTKFFSSPAALLVLLATLSLGGCAWIKTIVPDVRGTGDETNQPPADPPARQQIYKTAPDVLDQKADSLDTTPQTAKFSARRAALGSIVVVFRKQGNAAKAVQVLAAGSVTAQQDDAIRKLGDIVDSISTQAELAKWESAFGVTSPRPGKKKAPVLIEKQPPPPIPKLKPAEIPNKIDPL
jgi:hypothetical protein